METPMADPGLQSYQPKQAESEPRSVASRPDDFAAYRSVMRLLVGLALIGGDDLMSHLRGWENAHPPGSTEPDGPAQPESSGDLARRVLIGMLFEAAETAARVVTVSASLPASIAGALWSTIQPVADSSLFRPFWAPIRAIATRGENNFQRYTQTGRFEEQRSHHMAAEVTGLLIEDMVSYAGQNPGVKALVDAQVGSLLPTMVTDPTIQQLLVEQLGTWMAGLATRPETLDPLVREVGDRYIAYLNEHPDEVQNLVQGQAVGMAAEVRDNVRTVTVTGDTFLETVVRGVLRRAPREDLPPPNLPRQTESTRPTAAPARPDDGAK
jgi:hypothetical protein